MSERAETKVRDTTDHGQCPECRGHQMLTCLSCSGTAHWCDIDNDGGDCGRQNPCDTCEDDGVTGCGTCQREGRA